MIKSISFRSSLVGLLFAASWPSRCTTNNATDAKSLETKAISSAPTPRVGSASAVLNGNMYLFSGRGGIDMAPIEEHGAVWCFDPASSSWSKITPADSSAPYPPARSYHCSTSDGKDTLFLHAGCPASGRLSDLWMFNVHDCTWSQAPDAPAPHRGGTYGGRAGGGPATELNWCGYGV